MLNKFDIMDSFDDDMLQYTESEKYKAQHKMNTNKIDRFRSKLPTELQSEFNQLMNSLSDEYSDYSEASYAAGIEHSISKKYAYEK